MRQSHRKWPCTFSLVTWCKRCGTCPFRRSRRLLDRQEDRKIIVCTHPREGLPGVGDRSLIKLEKSVFGLQESGRLWWLEFWEVFVDAGFVQSKRYPATFYFYDGDNKLRGKAGCHVDDCLWGGTGSAGGSSKEIAVQTRDMGRLHGVRKKGETQARHHRSGSA